MAAPNPNPCAGKGTLFLSRRPSSIKEAKLICRTCPNRQPCFDLGIKLNETRGVWGGVSFNNKKARKK